MGNHQACHLEEDLSLNDYRYLMKQTNLTPDVIQGWYREFLNVCPNGQLNKNQFIKLYKELENTSIKNIESIAEHVFQAFDRNGDHRIDFKEFLIAYALTSIGDPLGKLQYTFSLFDTDHSQSIELKEMIKLLEQLFIITGHKQQDYSSISLAKDIFQTLDQDHNQSLSKEEFINGCLENKSIRNVLSPFENDSPLTE
ncbi:unnamed protein product [Adineta steineri]|uniref:EF-hand domain-containing protein n=2 Tax=Adineta steineri TaxID=433720 RepID=A0A818YWJ4_9BILA|nr:unnamed protein product [Adineta steineri]CAF3756634.1 unnamed protein product [Adineta steineri]